jgi:hypothetical protein
MEVTPDEHEAFLRKIFRVITLFLKESGNIYKVEKEIIFQVESI